MHRCAPFFFTVNKMSVFDNPALNKHVFETRQLENRQTRVPVREIRLKQENDEIAIASSQHRKHFLDWQGKWHKNWVAPTTGARNKPLKKVYYDIYSDTRSIWPAP